MDAIHRPEKRPYVTEKINIRDFIQEWMDILEQTENEDLSEMSNVFKENKVENIAKLMSQPLQVVECIRDLCSVDNLTCENELTIHRPAEYEIPPGVHLLSVKERKQELDQRTLRVGWCQTIAKNSRYQHHNKKLYGNLHRTPAKMLKNKITGPDVVLDVQVFKSTSSLFKKLPYYHELLVDQELRVLGRQPLTSLRDNIHCPMDYSIPDEVSKDPFSEKVKMNKEVYTSGFFFIEDTFYNDLRKSSSTDYSKEIRDWSKKKEEFGPLKTADMSKTCFGQLTIRLGHPYVYLHQGYCEHLIIFSDLRILSPHDSQDMENYPLVKSISRKMAKKCMMCNTATVRWLTTNDERLPETPFFFCHACFLSFNYRNGKKVADFKAYHYFDRAALP